MSEFFIDEIHEKNIKNALNLYNEKLNNLHKNKSPRKEKYKSLQDILGMEIQDKSDIFLTEYNSANFIQYSHLYYLRLKIMKNDILQKARKRWKKIRICENIFEMKGSVRIFFLIIGN